MCSAVFSVSYVQNFSFLRRVAPVRCLTIYNLGRCLKEGRHRLVDLRACHNLSDARVGRLEKHLYDHNREATGHHDGRGMAFEALHAKAGQIGAVAGYTWAGMAEIRQLWVDKTHRGHGLGRKLIEAVIAEATARHCKLVWVTTHSFQAPGLYEKFGFHRIAELRDWPPGHTKVILRLRIDADD